MVGLPSSLRIIIITIMKIWVVLPLLTRVVIATSQISFPEDHDDGYNSDDNDNSPNQPDEITKIVENYGTCPNHDNHPCLWYKMRFHKTGTSNSSPSPLANDSFVDGPLGRTCASPSCLDAHMDDLQRDDPQFFAYLQKRFYLLKGMRERNREFRHILERVLENPAAWNQMMEQPFVEGSRAAAVAAGLESLVEGRRMRRNEKYRQACRAQLAHYLHDVHQLLQRQSQKLCAQQSTMDRWISTGYTQKEYLYKILLHAQRRDMQRLLQLRELKLWYQKKLHLLDKLSKQRLARMLKWLQEHELRFQKHLWDRLEQLQHSANDWTKHEKAYKEALLALSRQQHHLFASPCGINQRLDRITNLISQKFIRRPEQACLHPTKNSNYIKAKAIVHELQKCCCAQSHGTIPKPVKKIARLRFKRHGVKACPKLCQGSYSQNRKNFGNRSFITIVKTNHHA